MKAIITYSIAVILLVVAYFLPPQGEISSSVLIASSIIIGGFQLMFGHSIKEISIDKNGVHISTHNIEDVDNTK